MLEPSLRLAAAAAAAAAALAVDFSVQRILPTIIAERKKNLVEAEKKRNVT